MEVDEIVFANAVRLEEIGDDGWIFETVRMVFAVMFGDDADVAAKLAEALRQNGGVVNHGNDGIRCAADG